MTGVFIAIFRFHTVLGVLETQLLGSKVTSRAETPRLSPHLSPPRPPGRPCGKSFFSRREAPSYCSVSCHSHHSGLPFPLPRVLPGPSIPPSLPPPSVLAAFTLADVNGTSLSRCVAMSPAVRKSTHTPLSVFLRAEPPPFHSPSRSLVSQISRGWSLLSGGTRRPIKYLWINIHSNVWQWEKSCDRKTDMACLCTTCSKGGAELVLSVCVCVCVWPCLTENVIVVCIFLDCWLFDNNQNHTFCCEIFMYSSYCAAHPAMTTSLNFTVDTKLADVTNP